MVSLVYFIPVSGLVRKVEVVVKGLQERKYRLQEVENRAVGGRLKVRGTGRTAREEKERSQRHSFLKDNILDRQMR